MRKRLARALPEIADRLVAGSVAGQLANLKALVQLSGLDGKDLKEETPKLRGRSFEEILMEDWRKESLDGSGSDG